MTQSQPIGGQSRTTPLCRASFCLSIGVPLSFFLPSLFFLPYRIVLPVYQSHPQSPTPCPTSHGPIVPHLPKSCPQRSTSSRTVVASRRSAECSRSTCDGVGPQPRSPQPKPDQSPGQRSRTRRTDGRPVFRRPTQWLRCEICRGVARFS